MSFVVYDVETTGLIKSYDQIVQFAAVRTDADLSILDRIELKCRLMPHVIPSPEALHITGHAIADLTDAGRPSHFEMVTRLRGILEGWCPTLFLGFNSISFDEEILRHAFYQCLMYPYLTNSRRSARADVLNLCRVTAAVRADVLRPATGADGKAIFKLAPLAEANGIAVTQAHDAMFDVMTTLALCRHIKAGAPEIWSQFLRFSQKASVEDFIKEEGAFLLSENVGNDHKARVAMRIGGNSSQTQKHYCLDLAADTAALRALDENALTELCRSRTRPVITLRSNAAPTLWSLDDALPEDLTPFHADDVRAIADQIRNDLPFMERLARCAEAAEPVYPPSPYVEDQLYDRLYPPPDDQDIHQQFHRADWPQRAAMISRFSDDRSRRLARRLVYMERPDLLGVEMLAAIEKEVARRFSEAPEGKMSWRSIPMANDEMSRLLDKEMPDAARASQRALAEFLAGRVAS